MRVHVDEAREEGAPAAVEHPGVEGRRRRAYDDLADPRALHDHRRTFDGALRPSIEDSDITDDEDAHPYVVPTATFAAATVDAREAAPGAP
jgi:hypothetical protein